jgi:hypothetical protein
MILGYIVLLLFSLPFLALSIAHYIDAHKKKKESDGFDFILGSGLLMIFIAMSTYHFLF